MIHLMQVYIIGWSCC